MTSRDITITITTATIIDLLTQAVAMFRNSYGTDDRNPDRSERDYSDAKRYGLELATATILGCQTSDLLVGNIGWVDDPAARDQLIAEAAERLLSR